MAVIEAKQKGKTIDAPEPEKDEEPADLLAALKASVEAAKARGRRAPSRRLRVVSLRARSRPSRRSASSSGA